MKGNRFELSSDNPLAVKVRHGRAGAPPPCAGWHKTQDLDDIFAEAGEGHHWWAAIESNFTYKKGWTRSSSPDSRSGPILGYRRNLPLGGASRLRH